MTDREAAARDHGTRDQFAMLAFLLAAAVLFHQALLGDWEVLSPHALVTLAALWTLFRPHSVRRFFLLLTAVVGAWAVDMPAVSNHWMLMGLAIVGAFIALGWGAIRSERDLFEPGALFVRLAPYLRILVLLVYAFAALAKVNHSFLDPALSCGVAMYRELLDRIGLPHYAEWQQPFAIYGTIGIEAALPLLLAVRRTRLLGVACGVAFHTVLAVAGHVPFSGFAMAFYALFLPDDMPARARGMLAEHPRAVAALGRFASLARARLAFPLAALAFLLLASLITYVPWDGLELAIERAVQITFLVYALLLSGLASFLLRLGGSFTYRPGFLRLAHPVWFIGPALVVLNGVSPYMGLKTQSTFTMYSNLQTEVGRWNHLVVPEEMQLFTFQDDLVRVVDANRDSGLGRYAGTDTELVLFAMRTYADARPDTRLVYATDGHVRTAARVGDDPLVGQSPNPLLRKLLFFRDVPPPALNQCRVERRAYNPEQGS